MSKLRELVKSLIDSGKSQTEIAREAKVSQATIHKILYTETEHSLDLMRKFSQTYGVSIADLVAEEETEYRPVEKLSEKERHLLKLFKQLDSRRRERLIEQAEDMVAAQVESRGKGGGESNSKGLKSALK